MVLSLTRLMEDGKDIKSDVDYCVDRCGLLHNIRETIFLIREQAETARTTLDTQALLSSGANYLARYVHLIALNNYLREQSPKLDVSFNEWTAQHHEFCKPAPYASVTTILTYFLKTLLLRLSHRIPNALSDSISRSWTRRKNDSLKPEKEMCWALDRSSRAMFSLVSTKKILVRLPRVHRTSEKQSTEISLRALLRRLKELSMLSSTS
jgi:hypothetical protein